MKLAWNKKNKKRPSGNVFKYPNLPFERQNDHPNHQNDNDPAEDTELTKKQRFDDPLGAQTQGSDSEDASKLFDSFQSQGTKLAEDGKYREALGKWESALMLKPENAVLHEQKAQVLIEIGDAWNAIKAATQATSLEPSWAEAWVTLGRAQLNFGEPDSAIESFDKALAIKPDFEEALDDRNTAMNLMKRRKQLHLSGLSPTKNRYEVGDRT